MTRFNSSNGKYCGFGLIGCTLFVLLILQPTSFNIASSQSEDKKVEFVANIEQMKGHLEQAVANKESGNDTLTLAHVLHPIAELYDLIEVELATADGNLNETLATSLDELSKNIEKLDSTQFIRETDKLNGMLDNAIKLITPEDNSTLNILVINNLLDTANAEYEEGVQDGVIKEIVEYQDANGFISRAGSLLNKTSSTLNDSMKTSTDEVVSLFVPLKAKLEAKSEPMEIETSINDIKQRISSITGISAVQLGQATEESGNKSLELINNIRDLLTQVTQNLEKQNYTEAEELATKAYLDNFEFIESDLAKQDKKLMEDTETLLREELRQMIKDKKTVDEVQTLVDQIKVNLETAEKLLS
jgi:hypothetical protein